MNDPLGDMLTRIRNAQMRGKSSTHSPASKLRTWVLDVLKDEGYIRGYEKTTIEEIVRRVEKSFAWIASTVIDPSPGIPKNASTLW